MSKYKYSEETKIAIIKTVEEGELTQAEIAEIYGVPLQRLEAWLLVYRVRGIEGLMTKESLQKHSGEFKQMVVEDIRNNGLAMNDALLKYGIPSHKSVRLWERIYLEEGPEGLYKERRGRGKKSDIGTATPPKIDKCVEEDLIAENQRLRAEVSYLKKLNVLVLERELREKKRK